MKQQAESLTVQKGLRIPRAFTKEGLSPFDQFTYEKRTSTIKNPDGSIVFHMDEVEVPASWTQVATDILAQKYFRKAGVPLKNKQGQPLLDENGKVITGSETSIKQVAHRIAGCWRSWGEQYGYFASQEDAQIFYEEMVYMIIGQVSAPNSPQWFTTGLNWAYGINGPAQGHSYVDPVTKKLEYSKDAYSRSQPHACFIQSIRDDLVTDGGIFSLLTREARVFKYGSGCTGAKSYVWTTFCGLEQMEKLWSRMEMKYPVHADGEYASYIEPIEPIYTLALQQDGTFIKDKINQLWRFNIKPTDKLRIKTTYGAEALVSSWHPCMILEQGNIVERRTDELKRGDLLVVSNKTVEKSWPWSNNYLLSYSYEHFGKIKEATLEVDAEIGWLVGYFIGDGSIGYTNYQRQRTGTRKLRVRFYDETRENLERVQDIMQRRFEARASIRYNAPRKSKALELTITQEKAAGFFHHFCLAGSKTYSTQLPSWIFKSPVAVLRAVVAGLLDSDGTISADNDTVRAMFSTASPKLAEQLQALVSYLGWTTTQVSVKSPTDRTQTITVLARNTSVEIKQAIAAYMSHPTRREHLSAVKVKESKTGTWRRDGVSWTSLGLDKIIADKNVEHFQVDVSSDLKYSIDRKKFYLAPARSQNRIGKGRAGSFLSAVLPYLTSENKLLAERLLRILEGVTEVLVVESAESDTRPFYDFTMANYHNYLAGEKGMLTIHNTGSNFSNLRGKGERLSGGGTSSGLMSFLKIFDTAAGSVKSGGTTRRAAKMVCLDIDHPEIENFIWWKVREEEKVASLVAGSKILKHRLDKLVEAAKNHPSPLEDKSIRKLIKQAAQQNIPLNYIVRAIDLARQGQDFPLREFDTHYESEAYQTVSGQNSNNSIRIPNSFFEALHTGRDWQLKGRTSGEIFKTISTKKLWDDVAYCAWASADPGVQFDSTINEWHTCPVDGRINASNPCVTGDTLVLIEEGKWKRIDAIIGAPTTILTNTGIVQPSFISGSFSTGRKPVYTLTTKAGYELKLTADHRVFTVNRGFVPACELTKDDYVLLPSMVMADIQETEDPTFYQLIGVYLGDGCGTDQKTIQLTMSKEREIPVLEKFATYVGEGYERITHKNSPAIVAMRPTSSAYVISNAQLRQKIAGIVDLSLRSHEKCISPAIFEAGLGRQKYVLQGLFTADGTVAHYDEKASYYISLDSSSLQLLKDVQLLLLGFGIKSKLYKNRRAGKTTSLLPDGKGGLKEYTVKETHSLRISRTSRKLFEEYIGFMPESYKYQQLKAVNETTEKYQEHPFDQIESLTYSGEEEVYDLTEPLTNTFVANGITIHNCSEYMFLDDTACNLASINVLKFHDEATGKFDLAGYRHTIRLWTIALEISVLMAQFPSEEIARKSYLYRTLGLGFANLGTLLMVQGIPYDSEKGRAIAGALAAIMTGDSYATSAELASALGAFERYEANKEAMLRVMRNHRRAAYDEERYEELTIKPYAINQEVCPTDLLRAAQNAWDKALEEGEQYGYRNAQVTVCAPTGTIGLSLDCDTTGVEPDYSIVKFKKLAGGGYFKIVNQSVPKALRRLGYAEQQIKDITNYCLGQPTFQNSPYINRESLQEQGFSEERLTTIEKQLSSAMDIRFVFNQYTVGEEFYQKVMEKARVNAPSSKSGNSTRGASEAGDLLSALGFTEEQINAANEYICGTMTLEGAPHLKEEHYPIFDCANRCGKKGQRYIHPYGHLKMLAAVQSFISGAISKTINMPPHWTVQQIQKAYYDAWTMMIKAVALYRDGSKLSQPLNATLEQNPELKAVLETALEEALEEEKGQSSLIEVHRKILLGQRELHLSGVEENGRLLKLQAKMAGMSPAQESMLTALVNMVNMGLSSGTNVALLSQSLAVEGHPVVQELRTFLQQYERGHPTTVIAQQTAVPSLPRAVSVAAITTNLITPPLERKMTVTTADSQAEKVKCSGCGATQLRPNGSCLLCEVCGETSGCS